MEQHAVVVLLCMKDVNGLGKDERRCLPKKRAELEKKVLLLAIKCIYVYRVVF